MSLFAASTDAPVRADPVEVESVEEFDDEGLREMMQGKELTPDSSMLLGEYLRLRPRRPQA